MQVKYLSIAVISSVLLVANTLPCHAKDIYELPQEQIRQRCNNGDARACFYVIGETPSEQKYYKEKSCQLGFGLSCFNLARDEFGTQMEKKETLRNFKKVHQLLEKGCSWNHVSDHIFLSHFRSF